VALLIGLASGAYSSIFIASPLLCDFKEREPTYQQLAKRVATRQAKDARDAAAGVAVPVTAGAPLSAAGMTVDAMDEPTAPRTGTPPRTGSRPTQQRRKSSGGRPGGRGGKSRKRR
jgi:preprotein translocase subunit SecF